MYPYCFFNGKITKSDRPLISLNDIAILRGFAAFDFMRIYNGIPFQFKDHMTRFKNTAKLMGLRNPFSDAQIREALVGLIKKNKDKDYQVRFILTGGPTKNGLFPSVPVFYILFEKMSDYPDSLYKTGAKLITYEHERILAEAKNSSYVQAVLLQKKRLREKAIEVLYTNGDIVLEASTSNIFIVKDGCVITPKDDILKGITRKITLDIAKKLGMITVEGIITKKDLKEADEMFITATNKKVLPIIKIDSKIVGEGKPGRVTKILLEEYQKLINK